MQAAYNFSNKRHQHRCFPVNFAKSLGTSFFLITSGRLLLFTILEPNFQSDFYNQSAQTKYLLLEITFNHLSANFTKWSNTLKQFVGNFPKNCLSVFDHFVGLALQRLNNNRGKYFSGLTITMKLTIHLTFFKYFTIHWNQFQLEEKNKKTRSCKTEVQKQSSGRVL